MAQPESRSVRANDHMTFEVQVAGSGAPLLFLHAAGGLAWDPFLNALSERFTVYAPHMPGTAGSSSIDHVHDLWDMVLCYYDLLDALGLNAVSVVGHSLGGMLGAELAANDQSRVNRLVLIAAAGLWLEQTPIPDMFTILPREMPGYLFADPQNPIALAMGRTPEDPEAQVEALVQRTAALQAAAKFLWPIPDKGLSRRIHRIQAPALLIWGRQDRLVPPVYGEEFRQRIPGSRLVVLDNAAHMVPLEQLDRVVEEVATFLAEPAQLAG